MIEHDEMLRNIFLGKEEEDVTLSTPLLKKVVSVDEKLKLVDGTPTSVMTQTDSEDEDGI